MTSSSTALYRSAYRDHHLYEGEVTRAYAHGLEVVLEGGLTGRVPLQELTYGRVFDPEALLHERHTFRLLRFDEDTQTALLSLRQASDSLWEELEEARQERRPLDAIITSVRHRRVYLDVLLMGGKRVSALLREEDWPDLSGLRAEGVDRAFSEGDLTLAVVEEISQPIHEFRDRRGQSGFPDSKEVVSDTGLREVRVSVNAARRAWLQGRPTGGGTARIGEEALLADTGPRLELGGKILLLEDDRVLAALLRDLLELKGGEVLLAHTVAEAQSHLETCGPQGEIAVLLVDLHIDSEPVWPFLRSVSRLSLGIRIVIQTGDPGSDFLERLNTDARGAGHLEKPYSVASLVASLSPERAGPKGGAVSATLTRLRERSRRVVLDEESCLPLLVDEMERLLRRQEDPELGAALLVVKHGSSQIFAAGQVNGSCRLDPSEYQWRDVLSHPELRHISPERVISLSTGGQLLETELDESRRPGLGLFRELFRAAGLAAAGRRALGRSGVVALLLHPRAGRLTASHLELAVALSEVCAARLSEVELTRERLNADAERLYGQRIHSFTHELNNALQCARSATDILRLGQGQLLKEQQRRHLRELEEGLQTAKELCEIYLHPFTRTQLDIVDLANVVQLSTRLLQLEARWQKVEILPTQGREGIKVLGASARIFQVATNLLQNALQWTSRLHPHGGGKIWVEVEGPDDEHGKWAILRVTDNGPGLHLDDIDRIFDEGVTLREGGRGLGLAISREIIEAMEGELRVSWTGRMVGCAFEARLPRQFEEEKHG